MPTSLCRRLPFWEHDLRQLRQRNQHRTVWIVNFLDFNEVLSDPDDVSRLSERSSRRVEDFDWSAVADAYEVLFSAESV